MTRVFVRATGRRVSPFNDPIGEAPIANEPLSVWQDRAIAESGLERSQQLEPPCLVIPDTLFTTGEVLARFIEGAADRDAVLVLAASVFGEQTTAMQPDVSRVAEGWRFEAVRFVTAAGLQPVEVVVDPEEQLQELNLALPLRIDPDKPPVIALPRHPVITIHHWAHLLWANQAAGASIVRRVPWWKGLFTILWALLRSLSLNKWKVLAKLNTIGRNCDIHPTAVVEGSTLGDNVTVGPFARVMFSRIGDGAEIMPYAQVEFSTMGDRSVLAQSCGMRGCLIYPDAFCGFPMVQACVIGRETLTTEASYCIDLNFDRDIRVSLDGELVSTETRFLGSAIGHRCRVGTGIWVASGREVPNDTILMRDPAGVLARPPKRPGGRWFVRDGRAHDLDAPEG